MCLPAVYPNPEAKGLPPAPKPGADGLDDNVSYLSKLTDNGYRQVWFSLGLAWCDTGLLTLAQTDNYAC